MSYQKDREEFIARFAATATIPAHDAIDRARQLLSKSTTLQRLAEAQCNGDWPYSNGTRERQTITCPRCESDVVASDIKRGVCSECRAQDRVTAILADTPYKPYFQGDPRGAVLRLMPILARPEDIESGRERGLYVPAKG
jgi:hypothetical protein